MFLSSSPGVNGYGSVCHEPFPITNISSRFFRRRGEGCHFRFRAPANHLASLSFSLPVSGDLRLLSTNTCWYPLCDLHSFLTVTFLTGCHCSFQREDSINLISIVSVGYHVTYIISSTSSHADSMYSLDSLSPYLPIVHCSWQVLLSASSFCTKLMYANLYRSTKPFTSCVGVH